MQKSTANGSHPVSVAVGAGGDEVKMGVCVGIGGEVPVAVGERKGVAVGAGSAGVGAQEERKKTVTKKDSFDFISSYGVSQLAGVWRDKLLHSK